MTLPVFLLEADHCVPEQVGDEFPWTGKESQHAHRVLRLGVGDQLDLVDGRGSRWTCTVNSETSEALQLRIDVFTREQAPEVRVTVVQALAKGGRDEQAIELCTELGADAFIPWQADRSIVRWSGSREAKAHQKWVNVVRAAAKQSRRATVPRVQPMLSTKALVSLLEQKGADGVLILVADESATVPLRAAVENWVTSATGGEVIILVGPEGGISDSELASFIDCGGIPVRLGPAVLRSSTAGAAALTLVNVFTGRWQ